MVKVELNSESEAKLEKLAKNSSFFGSLLEFYKSKKFLTERQFSCLAEHLPKEVVNEIRLKIKDQSVMTRKIKMEGIQIPDFNQIPEFSKLKEFQKPLVELTYKILEANQGALMAWDMGSGKTYGAAFLIKYYVTQNYHFAIICPKTVLKKWYEIIDEFNIPKENCYFLTNFESAVNGKKTIFRDKKRGNGEMEEKIDSEELNDFNLMDGRTLFVIDEAHKFKNYKTKTSQLGMIINDFKKSHNQSRVLLLTGTLSESPLKLWVTGSLLNKFQNINEYFEFLINMGCSKGEYSWEFDEPQIYKSKIHDFMAPVMSRIKFEDIPNAPAQRIEIQFLDGPGVLDSDTEIEIQNAKAVIASYKTKAPNEIVEMMRQRQLRELEKLKEIAWEIVNFSGDTKYVVFLNYSKSIDLLTNYLRRKGKKVGIYDGRNVNERESIRMEFQNQKLDCLLCNIQAAQMGIDLHDTSEDHSHPRVALFSPCYNVQTVRQALGRIHRIGGGIAEQRFIIIENTIEESVWRNIAEKLDNLDNLNEGQSVLLKEIGLFEDEIPEDIKNEDLEKLKEKYDTQMKKALLDPYNIISLYYDNSNKHYDDDDDDDDDCDRYYSPYDPYSKSSQLIKKLIDEKLAEDL